MEPNEYGLIRQPDKDLIALLFPPLISLSEYHVEIIRPEYIEGYYLTQQGAVNANADMKYGVVDISKYDYILAPSSTILGAATYSGARNDPATGNINNTWSVAVRNNTYADTAVAYGLWHTNRGNPSAYAAINSYIDYDLPIIGFRRHRSDQVNPLGVIQPLNPGILQPGTLNPHDQDPDELDVQDPEEEQEES